MGIRRVARVSFEDSTPSVAEKARKAGIQYLQDLAVEQIDVQFIWSGFIIIQHFRMTLLPFGHGPVWRFRISFLNMGLQTQLLMH